MAANYDAVTIVEGGGTNYPAARQGAYRRNKRSFDRKLR
jgi:hypothetical protein